MPPQVSEPLISGGAYIRKRREAQGLTIADVAAGYATGSERESFAGRLLEIEQDRDVAGPATIDRLREIFRFDADVYRNLVSGLPAGTALCRQCACSWHDACSAPPTTRHWVANCHWVEADLCSRCIPDAYRQPAEPTYVLHARDPHSVAILSILAYLRLGETHHARRALDDAIRDDERRTFAAGVYPAPIDEKGGQAAAAIALDMTAWRTMGAPAIVAGELAHV